jgi:hypothetical protein
MVGSWKRIWLSIELMKGTLGTSWRYIRKKFQNLHTEVQQV